MSVLRIALDVPLDTSFDYLAGEDEPAAVGDCVLVPFGNRKVLGVVMEVAESSAVPLTRLRQIERVVREVPPLPADLIALLRFCSDYYQYPLGQAVINALPARLRSTRPIRSLAEPAYQASEEALRADIEILPPRRIAQRRLLRELKAGRVLTRAAAGKLVSRPGPALQELARLGLAKEVEVVGPSPDTPEQAPSLNSGQQDAACAISRSLGGYRAWLLHGVTGSGKTEVYLRVLAEVIGRGGQGLVLAPEINLTPELEARFRRRFPAETVVSLHSGLAAGDRLRNWVLASTGRAGIVLGTRLAVFTPLPALALIVVDEEHDASYKQEEGLRYSARDVAVFRAKHAGVPVVLGSATPSLESLHNANRGRYGLLRLTQRAVESAELPVIRLVDLRRERLQDGLSQPLLDAVAARLERGEQSLVFINRRGFAPVLACPSCGWVSPCPRCSGRLVVHLDRQRLLCHHCGHAESVPRACPGCGNQDLRPLGHGTQRVESALAALFPAARVARVDRDTARRRHSWQQVLSAIRDGRIDVLVGTQILSKGHDLPSVSLVGVLNADSALYASDFRAAERLFAQLIQVAGRAGRGAIPGEVLVQTQFPDHPLYQALCRHDFDTVAAELLEERRDAGFPPFVHQALLRAESPQRDRVMDFLGRVRALAPAGNTGITLFEPVPAPMARVAGMERGQLLVQCDSRAELQRFLVEWRRNISALQERHVRWALDVDPLDA